MDQNISIDHGAYLKATGQMADVIPTIDHTAKKLEASVVAAEAGWKGQAFGAFKDYAKRLGDSINNLHSSLTELANALEQGNKHLGGADSHNSESFKKMDAELSSPTYTNLH
jgi:uncharacterized protein YukE